MLEEFEYYGIGMSLYQNQQPKEEPKEKEPKETVNSL